ncbi:MAG: thiolase family protein, partial [bacterium]|nr:thiolase family protein [bacterium]
QAYQQAGIGPADIDVAEVHDAMAPGEMMLYEELGFCGKGEARFLVEQGRTRIGGDIPVNPSGGLVSRGHPVGATGLAQVAEIVWQLRGEAGERQVANPRVGLCQNTGGYVDGDAAACCVTILKV